MELEECIVATCKRYPNTWIRFPQGLPIDADKFATATHCFSNPSFIYNQMLKNKTRVWYLKNAGGNHFLGDNFRCMGEPVINFEWNVNRELGEL